MNEAQRIINEASEPRWTSVDFMQRFYPTEPKALKEQKPRTIGFKWSFKLPSALTAEEVVLQVEQEGVKIKRPLFFSNDKPKRFYKK